MSYIEEKDSLGCLHLKNTSPVFFKIIIDDAIELGILRLPRKFVVEYGEILGNRTLFKVPSGEVWGMELQRRSNELLIRSGWKKFVEYYSLVPGYLLVFEFDLRNRYFKVTIFDNTGCEILYPYNIMTAGTHRQQNYDTSDGAREEFKEDKKMADLSKSHDDGSKSKTKAGIAVGSNDSTKEIKKRPGLKDSALSIAAACFKSKKPHFIIEMQATYLDPAYTLCVPSKFGRNFFGGNGSCVLSVLGKKEWTVNFFWVKSAGRKKVRFYKGWKKFAQENRLKVGDACAFELVKESELKFNVVIFRVAEASGSKNPRSSTEEAGGGAEGSGKFNKEDGIGNGEARRSSSPRAKSTTRDSSSDEDLDSDSDECSSCDSDDSSDETYTM